MHTCKSMDYGQINGHTDGWNHRCMGICMMDGVWMDQCMYVWMEGWVDAIDAISHWLSRILVPHSSSPVD